MTLSTLKLNNPQISTTIYTYKELANQLSKPSETRKGNLSVVNLTRQLEFDHEFYSKMKLGLLVICGVGALIAGIILIANRHLNLSLEGLKQSLLTSKTSLTVIAGVTGIFATAVAFCALGSKYNIYKKENVKLTWDEADFYLTEELKKMRRPLNKIQIELQKFIHVPSRDFIWDPVNSTLDLLIYKAELERLAKPKSEKVGVSESKSPQGLNLSPAPNESDKQAMEQYKIKIKKYKEDIDNYIDAKKRYLAVHSLWFEVRSTVHTEDA